LIDNQNHKQYPWVLEVVGWQVIVWQKRSNLTAIKREGKKERSNKKKQRDEFVEGEHLIHPFLSDLTLTKW
jgi:hypothetical protein